MEMCYDGALVMPNKYAIMNEDEMMYVEGGWTFSASECNEIAANWAIAAGAATVVGGIATLLVAIFSVGNWVATAIAGCIAVVIAGSLATISGIFWKGSCGDGLSISWRGLKFL